MYQHAGARCAEVTDGAERHEADAGPEASRGVGGREDGRAEDERGEALQRDDHSGGEGGCLPHEPRHTHLGGAGLGPLTPRAAASHAQGSTASNAQGWGL